MLLETGSEDGLYPLEPAAVPAYVDKIVRGATILSVRSGDVLQAFLAFYCNDPQRRVGYLSMLLVHRDHRQKGLAALLVEESVRRLRHMDFYKYRLEVHRENVSAIRLYERLGFERTGEESERTLFMELLLAPTGPTPIHPL